MRDRKIDQLEKEVTPRRLTCTVEGLSLALRQGDHEPAAGRRALVTSCQERANKKKMDRTTNSHSYTNSLSRELYSDRNSA